MNRTLFIRLGFAASLVLALGLTAPASGTSTPAVTDGRLVFNDFATGQLYTSNPDGSALVQVTHLRASLALAPQWSPDSTRIAYFSFPSGEARIFEINADGTGRHLVTEESPGYGDWGPSYTPDGQRIVYARCRPDPPGGCAVYSVRTDGTDRQAITAFGHGDKVAFITQPRVSPNGQWVAFSRFGWKGIQGQTWLVRMDGTDAHPITAVRLRGIQASWAPNSRALYFQAGIPSGLNQHIFRTPVGGGHATQLSFTEFPNGDFNPSASPSGGQIAFISDRSHPDLCCQDLYVMNADGSDATFIDTGLLLPGQPDWGSAPLQSGPSVQVEPVTREELQAAREQALAERQTWPEIYGKVGGTGYRWMR
jgi:Tol biopolymer transport system component